MDILWLPFPRQTPQGSSCTWKNQPPSQTVTNKQSQPFSEASDHGKPRVSHTTDGSLGQKACFFEAVASFVSFYLFLLYVRWQFNCMHVCVWSSWNGNNGQLWAAMCRVGTGNWTLVAWKSSRCSLALFCFFLIRALVDSSLAPNSMCSWEILNPPDSLTQEFWNCRHVTTPCFVASCMRWQLGCIPCSSYSFKKKWSTTQLSKTTASRNS